MHAITKPDVLDNFAVATQIIQIIDKYRTSLSDEVMDGLSLTLTRLHNDHPGIILRAESFLAATEGRDIDEY